MLGGRGFSVPQRIEVKFGWQLFTGASLEAIKYVFLMCMYKKSKDSEKVPTLNTHGKKNDRT